MPSGWLAWPSAPMCESSSTLPDGAMIAIADQAYAVRGRRLLRWTPAGYGESIPRRRGVEADVLTPPSILDVLKRGYTPLWHASAG